MDSSTAEKREELDPNLRLQLLFANPEWRRKPKVPTEAFHHYASVIERGDIEEVMHSQRIDVFEAGVKLDGKRNKTRLVQVLGVGPGRWVPNSGGRQPAEVEVDQLCYVKERTIPFKVHFRGENQFFIAMDAIMAELDTKTLNLRPLGQHIITKSAEDREQLAVMGASPILLPGTPALGVDKRGQEADDIGCNTRRIEEVVAVGPGKFGGYVPELGHGPNGELKLTMVPYWETPDCKVGDLVVFTDMARPTTITIAGRNFTAFEFDHTICGVLDPAAV